MVTWIGFNEKPYSVIMWHKNGQAASKTVCFTIQDEVKALSRFYDSNDFYSKYEKAVVYRGEDSFEVVNRMKEVV